jgi:cellulose biosynthesis protein BcsQ
VKVIAAYNFKGGVGKTAAAVNLAQLAADSGARTLLWDLDAQGAATWYFRVKPKVKGGGKALVQRKRELDDVVKGTDFEGLDLVPADFSYRHMDLYLDGTKKPQRRLARILKPLRKEYDWVILDCPPGAGLLFESIFEAVDALVVPVIPTTLSVRGLDQLDQLDRMLERAKVGAAVLPFCSMVDRRKKLHREVVEQLHQDRPTMLRASIPSASVVERMGVERAPVNVFAPRTKAAAAYRDLWDEVQGRLA